MLRDESRAVRVRFDAGNVVDASMDIARMLE